MTSIDKIMWGSYKEYSGPFYRGSKKLTLAENPDFLDEAVYVFSSTEGCIDSVNMYDKCIVSVGCAQWCEGFTGGFVELIGLLAAPRKTGGNDTKGYDYVIKKLRRALNRSSAVLKKNKDGDWNFFFKNEDGTETEVITLEQKRKLYLNATGKKADWSKESKLHAKVWAHCIVGLWAESWTHTVQLKFTKDRMLNFALSDAKKILFGDPSLETNDSRIRCIRAAYLSYAGNNPKKANDNLRIASFNSIHEKWSDAWLIDVLGQLTFGANTPDIYPHRYDAIVDELVQLYSLDLPKNHKQLKLYYEEFLNVSRAKTEVQEPLKSLGLYDGAIDGLLGDKTRRAIHRLQHVTGIPVNGSPNEETIVAINTALKNGLPKEAPQKEKEHKGAEVTITIEDIPQHSASANESGARLVVRQKESRLAVFFSLIRTIVTNLLGLFKRS